jgi:diadenylate cyclase
VERVADWLRLTDLTRTDLLDILLLSVIIYHVVLLVRGTRATQMIVGIAFVLAAFWLTRQLELKALHKLLDYAIVYIPFIVIVVFQAEIRKALTALGKNPLLRPFYRSRPQEQMINELVNAVTTLSSRKVGALIVIERSQGLRNYAESGITLDAVVSYDLLVNIFTPETPLHDGAAIIRYTRVAAAACFLPLTLNPSLSRTYGTRHRAAIGISEETDAVAVVVSEESGQISVAVEGKITSGLWAEALNQILRTHFQIPEPERRSVRRATH